MKLSEKILIDVCHKSLENARELIDDADLLKSNNRIARSYTLFQLATEEVGKAIYCFLILFDRKYYDPKVESEFDKVFRSHKEKTEKSGSLNFIIAQVLYKGNFEGALKFLGDSLDEKNQLNAINDLKNFSLYTSIIDSEVRKPSEIINSDQLASLELKAKSRFGATSAFIRTGIEHIPALREYQKQNSQYKIDEEDYAKIFWKEIME